MGKSLKLCIFLVLGCIEVLLSLTFSVFIGLHGNCFKPFVTKVIRAERVAE